MEVTQLENNILEFHRINPKTTFTGLAITSNLAGASFCIGVGFEDTEVHDDASTTNWVAVIFRLFN